MGAMALGYGSEFHLLRWLGRHRDSLSEKVREAVGINDSIHWLDFGFPNGKGQLDEELQGFSFISDSKVQAEWKKFWPPRGTQHNWDCIGETSTGRLLLVEAKSHIEELKSSTKASEDSKQQIMDAFAIVGKSLGIGSTKNWTEIYYQLANRIAALWFLNKHCVAAALVNIYFLNDLGNSSRRCPSDISFWEEEIKKEYKYLGIFNNSFIKENVFSCFIEAYK